MLIIAYDPVPYDRGIFDNNRWLERHIQTDGTSGLIIGGFYDDATNRLYIGHKPVRGSGGLGRVVVSVYSI